MENLPPKRKELVKSLIKYYTALGNDKKESSELEALDFMSLRGVKCVPVTSEPLGWSPEECDDGEEWDENSHRCEKDFEIGKSFIIIIAMVIMLLTIVCFLTWYCYVRKTKAEQHQQNRLRGFKLLDSGHHGICHNKKSMATPLSYSKKNELLQDLGTSIVLTSPMNASISLSESLLEESPDQIIQKPQSAPLREKVSATVDTPSPLKPPKREKHVDRKDSLTLSSSYVSSGRGRVLINNPREGMETVGMSSSIRRHGKF